MPQTKLLNVLNELISLTRERDSDALALSLTNTLRTLAKVSRAAIYDAGEISRIKHALATKQNLTDNELITTNIAEGLINCLQTKKTLTIPLEKNKKLTFFPLFSDNKQPLGAISVEETNETDHKLTIQILEVYHNFISLMNENERDTLTGLLNRKTFDLKINDIISTAQRKTLNQESDSQEQAYLAIFDLDHFKRVNDTHGHLIGDEVLLLFSWQSHSKLWLYCD